MAFGLNDLYPNGQEGQDSFEGEKMTNPKDHEKQLLTAKQRFAILSDLPRNERSICSGTRKRQSQWKSL